MGKVEVDVPVESMLQLRLNSLFRLRSMFRFKLGSFFWLTSMFR